MQIFRSLDSFRSALPVVATMGTFDGVHLGHQAILKQVQRSADKLQGASTVVTFHPHPRLVLQGADAVPQLQLLLTLEERLQRLADSGIQNTLVVPFTPQFAALSPSEYIRVVLIEALKVKHLVIGYDHRFGQGRKGDFQTLLVAGAQYGFGVEEIAAEVIDAAEISSTRIRNALLAGEIADANALLGTAFCLSGTVVQGQQLGRTIGFPTANIQPTDEQKLVPGNGVYAVRVHLGSAVFRAMLNIGFRPTVGGVRKTIEAHILDFDADIYAQPITVEFVARLRDEQKFDGLAALKHQLVLDLAHTKALLS